MASAQRQIAKIKGWKGPKEVVPSAPPFPWGLRYLWDFFGEVSLGLQVTGMAPSVVTWESLVAWRSLTGHDLEAWEALALVRLGHARAVIQSEKIKTDGPQNPHRSG